MSNSSDVPARGGAGRAAHATPQAAPADKALGRRLSLLALLSAVLPLAALASAWLLLPDAAAPWRWAAAALGVAAAAGLGAAQARAVSARQQRQLAATRRRAANDFAALTALSQIDRAVLARLDLSEVARHALKCVRAIAPADAFILAVFDGEPADTLKVFVSRRESHPMIQARVPAPPGLQHALLTAAGPRWTGEPPLPDSITGALAREDDARRFCICPIARAGKARGALMLAHRADLALSAEQREQLAGVSDRLEMAFASIERDRELRSMAHTDPLTGLPNRHAMLGLLEQELGRARTDRAMAAILSLDLDRLKQTNDTLGHAIGDALLKEATRRIRAKLRSSDIVARPGGDEFTVVLGKLARDRDAGHIARELIKALREPFEVEGHMIYVVASVGIAVFPQDGGDGAELLKKANSAMFRARDQGRSRFAYYEESMKVETQRRLALDRDLRQAFERNELLLHYQPQIDLRTGRVCSVEALIRWQHPQKGMLYPAAFIPYAEESGLIDVVGKWVLKEACLQHQRWRQERVPIPCVSVNVSNRHVLRSTFLRDVLYLLDLARMPPGALEIEVTESAFMDGGKAGIRVLQSLTDAGVRVAIDDFGTDYSSFGVLRTLPAGVLKVDKSFLKDVPGDPDAESIVAAMISMAHALRKEVVAEGVEREEQKAFLERLRCEKVQGFLFARALDADTVARFCRERANRFTAIPGALAPLTVESP